MTFLLLFTALAAVLRLSLLALSTTNAARLRRAGGIEIGQSTSRRLGLAHLAFYGLCASEGVLRGAALDLWAATGALLYAAGLALLLLAIAVLGPRWTTRLIVSRSAPPQGHWLLWDGRHPQHGLTLIPELAGLALACHAFTTLTFALPAYGAILYVRMVEEEEIGAGRWTTRPH